MPEVEVRYEKRRGCGFRKKGGLYLTSGGSGGVLNRWCAIEPPILYEGDHFRGYVYVDGDSLLAGETPDAWLIGPSLDRFIRKSWVALLGMPRAVRVRFGILKGVRAADDLVRILNGLPPVLHEGAYTVATGGLHDLYYHEDSATSAHITDLHLRRDFLGLTSAQILAKCWMIAKAKLWEPSDSVDIVKTTSCLIMLMGLVGATEDAKALKSGEWQRVWKAKGGK